MSKIDYSKISRVLDKMGVDNEKHFIKFTMLPINSNSIYDENGTKQVDLKANVDVEVKPNGPRATFPVDLLKIPHHGESGFVIKGRNKQVISSYTISYGWYLIPASNSITMDHLKLTTEKGHNLLIYHKDYTLYISTGKKPSDPSVELAVFLKAVTGESYAQLHKSLGHDSIYATASFSKPEPLRAECVDLVVKTLFPGYANGKKDYEYDKLSGADRYSIIKDKLFNSSRMYLGNTTGIRLKRGTSFKERCKNLYLAEKVESLDKTFEAGTNLDPRMLDQLDHLPISELVVLDPDKKQYRVKKYSAYNFRALGCVLEADVVTQDKVFDKGTVLSLETLKELEQTDVAEILVSYGERIWSCRREVFDGSLKIGDIMSMVQVYTDSLAGLNLFDNVYSLDNQNLDTLVIRLTSMVTSNCKQIVNHIVTQTLTTETDADLLSKIIQIPRLPLDDLIEYVANSKTRESQQAELNNTIQKLSKESRVAKNVKRSSPGMTNIQPSQFSRLDPVESPESSKIGIVQTMAMSAQQDEFGFITGAFIRVENGKVVSKTPVYLSSDEQAGQFVASWDETFVEKVDGVNKRKKKILVMSDTTLLEVPIEDVKYKQVGPYDTMSVARMQAPFPEHSNQKRMLMSSNQAKQAVVSINNQRPWVSSGGDSLMTEGLFLAEDVLNDLYDSLDVGINMPREEFVKLTLTLKNIDVAKNSKILTLAVSFFEGLYYKLEIPFMMKANSGAMFSYLVNTGTGMKYTGKDVIAHSLDYDIRKYKIHKHVNFGDMEIDHSKFERALGPSRNLIVGYKTFESSTIDDAIVLSADIVGLDAMTSIELHQFTAELKKDSYNMTTGISETESFGAVVGSKAEMHLSASGLPKLNSILKPGDIAIAMKLEKKFHPKGGQPELLDVRPNNVIVDSTIEGQVVKAVIENNKAIVVVASLRPIETGDKLAGRHGNKGVIAKILPRHLMPYDPVTGMILDIVLNPQGVPSRSNISQILEVVLGMASMKLGQVTIVSPYVGDSLDFVKDMAAKANVHPMTLIDGRTGQPFRRKINVGVIYMLKLEHMVSHKVKGVGISGPVDPVFNQPSKGAGGQAFGEYESWVLESVGAHKVAQDIYSLQSDDLMSMNTLRSAFAEDLSRIDISGNNNNDHVFQVVFRALTVEPTYDKEGTLWFRPMTDTMIRALNSIPIDINNKASLESADIFGASTNNMAKFNNRTSWSWMPLHAEIVHPFYIVKGNINRFLLVSRVRKKKDGKIEAESNMVATADMLKDLIACRVQVSETRIGERYSYKFLYTGADEVDEPKFTGMEALVKILRNTSMQEVQEYYESAIERTSKDHIKARYWKILRGIIDFQEAGLTLEDFIISSLPVIPLPFRPRAKFDHIVQDFDFYYHRIIDEVVKHKAASIKSQEAVYSIYMRIVEFCGLTYGKEAKIEEKHKPLLKYFTGREGPDSKHGRIRESMLKKRVHFSGRTVIIPSSDIKRAPTKIGIPYMLCLKVWGPHLVHLLRQNFWDILEISLEDWKDLLDVVATNRVNFNKLASNLGVENHMSVDQFYDRIYSVVSVFIEGYNDPVTGEVVSKPRVVLAGRQPSLHKFSIRAYTPVIVQGKCIEIHPLVTTGYNADFDGDQMWFLGLINDDACEEALEKMSPKDGVINPKDSSVVLSHTQDIRLGVYYATMLHENVENISKHPLYAQTNMYFYDTPEILEADIDLGVISIHDLVCFNNKGRTYLSTAGRVLFNSLIPEGKGFTDEEFQNTLGIQGINPKGYRELRYDGLISGKPGKTKTLKYCSLPKITFWSYETFDRETNLQFYQKVSEFGFRYADQSGISLFLEDFVQSPEVEEYIAKAEVYKELINERYFEGAISDEERKEELVYLYQSCRKLAIKHFMSAFNRNNNIFLMFDSGARGSQDQIMQATGMIGILQKSKDEVLETPILTNYAKGLTCFDTLQSSYSTRIGVSSTQNETAVSGELTRLAIYTSSGFKVVEHDCGVEYEDFKIMYSTASGRVVAPDGELVAIDKLVGKKLVGNETVVKYLKNFLDDGKITAKCVDILLSKKVLSVDCDNGTYTIHYKPDTLMISLLKFRETEEGSLPHTIVRQGKHFISERTLRWVATQNPETVKVRTMLGCKSVGGVCARCYGIRYDSERYPLVGDWMGFESSQSVGEPASQLTLSLFHKGGAANESIDKGVEIYGSTLRKGFPTSRLPAAVIAPISGYVVVGRDKNRPRIESESGEIVTVFSDKNFIVDAGEYVEQGEAMTEGFRMPSDNVTNPTLDYIRFTQMCLLEIHYRVFESNSIDVNARHFEIFVRLQTSLAFVLDSEDENFLPGKDYEVNAIVRDAKAPVHFMFEARSYDDIITYYSGLATLLCHGKLADNLGSLVTTAFKSQGSSPLGAIALGQNLHTGEQKVFVTPKPINSRINSTRPGAGDANLVTNILLKDDLVKEIEVVNESLGEVNWDDLLLDDTIAKPTPVAPVSYTTVEQSDDGTKEEVDKLSPEGEKADTKKLGSMNIF